MPRSVLVDTGPLVALLHSAENRHAWVRAQFAHLQGPLLTCEAVLVEADHLIGRYRRQRGLILALLERGVLRIGMSLAEESTAVARIQAKYKDISASIADACLVRMSELYDGSVLMTFDEDFRVYRRHGRQVIPLLMPSG